MTNCGSGSESCCTSLPVTGGFFYRQPIALAAPATVSAFRLDKYLVTVGRFRQFVTAWNLGSGWTPAEGSGKHTHLNGGRGLVDVGASPDAGVVYESGWLTSDNFNIMAFDRELACPSAGHYTWTSSATTHENLPINCVSWYEAEAFCIWDGGFLPSQTEWLYAAFGGSEGRPYPWGTTAPGGANQYAIFGCLYPDGSGVCGGGVTNIAPVGTATAGAGRWGQLDLQGELWEWVLDWSAFYVTPCVDCAVLTPPLPNSDRVIVAAPFGAPADLLGGVSGFFPTVRVGTAGFRCARTP
jgi:formylglycine-generating enzyme required for sulfatase activity